MRGARSVESLDTAGRPGPLADLGRSYDDQQLHDALSEQRVGPGPPTSRRQAPGRSTVLVLFVCLFACFSYGGQFQRTTSSSDSPLFLPRDAMHKCDLCRHAVSVCLSVCVSVRLSRSWILSKCNRILRLFSPRGSIIIAVFAYQTLWRYSDETRMQVEYAEIAILSQYLASSRAVYTATG